MNAKTPYLPLPMASSAIRAHDRAMATCVVLICASVLVSATIWLRSGPSLYRTAESIRVANIAAILGIGSTLFGAIWFVIRLRNLGRLGTRLINLGPAPMRRIHTLSIALWGLALGCFVLRPPSQLADLVSVFLPGGYIFIWAASSLAFRRGIYEGGICDPSQVGAWSIPWASIRMALVADESHSLVRMLNDGATRELDISRTTPDEVRRILQARMPHDAVQPGTDHDDDDDELNHEDPA